MEQTFIVKVTGEPNMEAIREAAGIVGDPEDIEVIRLYIDSILDSNMGYDGTGLEVNVQIKD